MSQPAISLSLQTRPLVSQDLAANLSLTTSNKHQPQPQHPLPCTDPEEDTVQSINYNRGASHEGGGKKLRMRKIRKCLVIDTGIANGYKTYQLLPQAQVQGESPISAAKAEESPDSSPSSTSAAGEFDVDPARELKLEVTDGHRRGFHAGAKTIAGPCDEEMEEDDDDVGIWMGAKTKESDSRSRDDGRMEDPGVVVPIPSSAMNPDGDEERDGIWSVQTQSSSPRTLYGQRSDSESGEEIFEEDDEEDSFNVEDGKPDLDRGFGFDSDFLVVKEYDSEDEVGDEYEDQTCADIAARIGGGVKAGEVDGLGWQSVYAEKAHVWCVRKC
ncbi:hypothetical protein BKA65DRAFT_503389 [Rhexocercosporidium sp. MPI-PUGE-AT-0058]|nr:hypothetical protein BKA65DRAFT_503389 [Rhexocercosporidium sp. MPI-PUGE-AT-0058]